MRQRGLRLVWLVVVVVLPGRPSTRAAPASGSARSDRPLAQDGVEVPAGEPLARLEPPRRLALSRPALPPLLSLETIARLAYRSLLPSGREVEQPMVRPASGERLGWRAGRERPCDPESVRERELCLREAAGGPRVEDGRDVIEAFIGVDVRRLWRSTLCQERGGGCRLLPRLLSSAGPAKVEKSPGSTRGRRSVSRLWRCICGDRQWLRGAACRRARAGSRCRARPSEPSVGLASASADDGRAGLETREPAKTTSSEGGRRSVVCSGEGRPDQRRTSVPNARLPHPPLPDARPPHPLVSGLSPCPSHHPSAGSQRGHACSLPTA